MLRGSGGIVDAQGLRGYSGCSGAQGV
jgi:hypothetical protein